MPFTSQITGVFSVPDTVAVKTKPVPTWTFALVGEMVKPMLVMVTTQEAETVCWACETAKIVTVPLLGTLAGAV
jgi:hypothetical protein